jgi:uncharacterized protein YbjQ (UPF0145 family)
MTQIQSSGTWGSSLTTDEFAAIRSVGFEAVGQVFGAAVYAAGSASGSSCPGAWRSSGGLEPFGPLVQAMYQARQAAIGRMVTECAQLGGHGVVGVRLSQGVLPIGGLQFTAIGTAVRAPGVASGQRPPFTSDVSGQDFAKLIMTGWVPVGLALGISIGSRHDDWTTTRQARWSMRNVEVAGWTELVNQSRHQARGQLETDVKRLGAEGVVLTTMQMRVRERDCPATVGRHDHVVEATFIGTAIVRFSHSEQGPAGQPLTVMSLDPQRRQAARILI